MGAVFLARDIRLDRLVAIKVLPPHLAADSEVRELFLREARTAGRLSHPNIVAVFRADELSGHPFFAMPFIEGENLAERLNRHGPLPPADVVRWLREVAWALAYAHARGVIHRDVKPENIMVERGSGRAIVTDFGIARVEFGPRLSHDALIVGTASYMSPEQIADETIYGRSDLYSLGVVGFQLLSGTLPFVADTVSALLDAHRARHPPPLTTVAPTVPPPIAAVIDRCLAKDRDARYPTGESLADALEKAMRLAGRRRPAAATPSRVSSPRARPCCFSSGPPLGSELPSRSVASTRLQRARRSIPYATSKRRRRPRVFRRASLPACSPRWGRIKFSVCLWSGRSWMIELVDRGRGGRPLTL
jgi:serine/threonine protein kinase